MNYLEIFSFDWLKQVASNIWALITGLMTTVVGYFLPIKNIVHVVLFFFLLDIIFGYWAARKLRRERFSTKIVWQYTMPRILLSLTLIISAFMWDSVFEQEFISTYKVIGWFISGILIYSITKNGYKITHWEMFPMVGKLFERKIEEQTGINLTEEAKS
jgi:hypothetical protein